MTARITVHGTDQIIPNPGKSAWAMDGYAERAMTYRVPGQLWERVAEMGAAGVVNSPNYTARIADATRKVWLDGRYRRMGTLAIDAPAAGAREASGIIVAGVLHGSRLSAPYVHTGFECGAL